MWNYEGLPVPGLARGIGVLEYLAANPDSSLEELSTACRIPRASLLRILETLRALGLAERHEGRKRYSARASLVRERNGQEALGFRVQALLDALAVATGQTAEWYERDLQGMVLTRRAAPAESVVQVLARVGFIRRFKGELDSVNMIAQAWEKRKPGNDRSFWVYDPEGAHRVLGAEEVSSLVNEGRAQGWALDVNFNANGVRRLAAPATDGANLVGVLALAMCYTPGMNRQLPGYRSRLRDAVVRLSGKT